MFLWLHVLLRLWRSLLHLSPANALANILKLFLVTSHMLMKVDYSQILEAGELACVINTMHLMNTMNCNVLVQNTAVNSRTIL